MALISSLLLFICWVLPFHSAALDDGCVAGNDVIQRQRVDHGDQFAVVFPSKTWHCDGPIVEWQFFVLHKRNIKLIAFTKVPNTTTDWRVIDYNDIPVEDGGFGSYVVPEEDRIYVEAGNVLGFSGSNVKFSDGGDEVNLNTFSKMGYVIVPGKTYEMRWPKPLPRTYSIKGIVEVPQVSFDLSQAKVDEGMTLNVTLTNLGKYNHTVRVETLDGDARAGVDYVHNRMTYTLTAGEQATFEVETIVDDIYETEATHLTLSLFTGTTQIDWTENFEMHVSITSDVPCADFWWNDIDEYITLIEGHDPQEITAERKETSEMETIDLVIQHITSDDDDITIASNKVPFVAGESTSSIVSIMATDDCKTEDDESFVMTLYDPSSDTCSNLNRRRPYRIYVTIRNHIHIEADYFWKQSMLTVGENEGHVKICLKRSGCHTNRIRIDIQCEPAHFDVYFDFMPHRNRIEFTRGDGEACTNVYIVQDSLVEPTESFNCSIISNNDSVMVASPDTLTVYIKDDEVVSVGWKKSTYVYKEGNTVIAPVILKEGNITLTLTITATPVTATSSDFAINPTISVIIPANSTAHSLNQLDIIDDMIKESTEVFTLIITSVSFGKILNAVANIYIEDDDTKPAMMAAKQGIGGASVAAISTAIAAIVLIVCTVLVLYWYASRRRQRAIAEARPPLPVEEAIKRTADPTELAVLLDLEDANNLTKV